eukprot:9435985-Ditylum_brightwellii.AAC.1
MAHIIATIRPTTEWNIPLQHENYSYIMGQFMDSPNIVPEEVKLLNYYQLFLEITTTLEKKRVREEILYPHKIPMKPRHKLEEGAWPRQT